MDYNRRASPNPLAQNDLGRGSLAPVREAAAQYVQWITEAKTDATLPRTRRLETAGAWIAERKERNWRY